MIYLDNASTTRINEKVAEAMFNSSLTDYGNSSSNHFYGKNISKKIDSARGEISKLINCSVGEVYFNSGATEGINTVFRGISEMDIDKGNHIVITKVEHKAVIETCKYLEDIGFDITYLDVDENGILDLEELKKSIKVSTILVGILMVNNETGVIQDMKAIGEIVKMSNAKLFVDATQAVGKIPVDINKLNIDLLCFSGHKLHGPKGIGVLYINEKVSLKPLLYGGGHEQGIRSGTLNTSSIIGISLACEVSIVNDKQVITLMSYLENRILNEFQCRIVASKALRSPYITNILFKNVDAELVISKLKSTVLSTGSACSSKLIEPSHVLTAMGISDDDSFGSLRFSISRFTTYEEIDLAIEELRSVILK